MPEPDLTSGPTLSTTSGPAAGSSATSGHVVVIGAGLGGLAAACTAAARGYQVTLLDKNDWVGGKAAVHWQDGFRFDMGPTILTLPSVLKRIFAEAGKQLEDYLELVPLDPQWRCFFDPPAAPSAPSGLSDLSDLAAPGDLSNSSGSASSAGQGNDVLDLVADLPKMCQRLDRFTGDRRNSQGYRRFLQISEQLHGVSERFFFWRSIGGLADTMDLRGSFSPAVLKDVMSLRMGRSVADVVRQHVPDQRVAQMMDHFTQYVGSSPFASPAVLCGIAHMQTSEGIWYPLGGTRAVPEALQRLAEQLGVRILTGCDVQRIETEDRPLAAGRTIPHVTAVHTAGGGRIACDAVISNSDAVRTYGELLQGLPRAKRFAQKQAQQEPACSGVVFYWGLNRRYEQLLHHNFVFSRDPQAEFDAIYQQGQPADDPTAYVCAPAITEPAVAPPGGEALYVLVHTPYLRPEHDWQAMLPAYRELILDKLQRTAGLQGLREAIQCESVLTPEDIHNRYRVLRGAIYGVASHGKYLGAFKAGNRRHDVGGLYLAGGAAHPGPGMPMVTMSGWIAADALDQDIRGASS